METGRGNAFAAIAKDERIMGLDRADVRHNFKILSSYEYSSIDRKIAAKAIVRIARKNRLDALADAAENGIEFGPKRE